MELTKKQFVFFTACEQGNVSQIRKCLLDKSLNPCFLLNGKTPLFVSFINPKAFILLCNDKRCRESASMLTGYEDVKTTIVHMLSWRHHLEKEFDFLAIMCNVGIDVDVPDSLLNRPSHVAAENGNIYGLTTLIRHGIDITARDGLGRTPLHRACINEHVRVVIFLLSVGADPNIQCNDGNSTFMEACKTSNLTLIRVLSSRSNLTLLNKFGYSAMHLAAMHNRVEVLQYLRTLNIDWSTLSFRNETPLTIAILYKSYDAIEYLCTAGVDIINCINGYLPALSLALVEKDHRSVTTLLRYGANPNLCEKEGFTPLCHAAVAGYLPNLIELRKAGANMNCPIAIKLASANSNQTVVSYLTSLHPQLKKLLVGQECANCFEEGITDGEVCPRCEHTMYCGEDCRNAHTSHTIFCVPKEDRKPSKIQERPIGNVCSICLDEAAKESCDELMLKCGHLFHKECIVSLKEHSTCKACPVCRHPF